MKRLLAIGLILSLLLMGCQGNDGEPSAPTATNATPTASETGTVEPTPSATTENTPQFSGHDNTELSVLFINVGYGDAILIQVNGKNYMVDTGAKDAVTSLYRALTLQGVSKLDGLFLTHTHSDHVGGAQALAQRCEIDTLYSAEISMDKKNGGNVIDELAQEIGLSHTKLKAGDIIDIGDGAYFEVLGPLVYNGDDDNDNSLVMMLHAGGVTLLLTGDMQFAEEQTLLDANTALKTDILKVGNHGNPDATSEVFAKTAAPVYAMISTSTAQDDDTPNPRVLDALDGSQIFVTQDYECGILLTAKDGKVEISNPEAPAKTADIAIQEIDKEMQTVTLINNGVDADLSGYFIISEKGSEFFVFPQGAMLAAGQTLTVACRGGQGDYIWDDSKVWSKKDDEAGALYDAYGNELSQSF